MALGGGTYTTQNKTLPGAYINFVSTTSASATLSDRGVATMPLELDWGPDDEVFEISSSDFTKYSLKLLGHAYTDDALKGLRDLFINATTLYAYRLNSGGTKASNDYATAKYSGTRGNDLKIVIQQNVDDESMYDVMTYIDTTCVDEQTVSSADELEDNDYVTFKSDAALALTASTPLTGGTNGEVSGSSYQSYLDKIESYTYNTMGVVVTDDTTKSLFVSFVKRLRDEMGIKFQLVLYDMAADYYGVINVKNPIINDSETTAGGAVVGGSALEDAWSEASLVYWVTGASAGCAINASLQNNTYDGEFDVYTDYTQSELEAAIEAGEFVFHKVNSVIRVLTDINSMVTTSDTEGDIFKDNQTIRVIDQIANDIAVLFTTKYLGTIPNDEAGRISLWSDIVQHHQELADLRAIEDFSDSDVTVEQGDTKKAVVVSDAITVINAMDKLYMEVVVS